MPPTLTRHEAPPTAASLRLNRVILVVLLALEVYILLSVLIRPGGSKPEFNFKSEHGSITLLSSTLFLVGAVIAARTLRTMWWGGIKTKLMWAGLAVVLLYFSVDEVVGFHEAAGDVMDADVGAGPFRTWNDLVVLAYGAVAAPAALIFWREILRYERLLIMFMISGVLYVSTSMVDTLSTTPTTASVILEEGIKVHCSTMLMLSALTGLYAARKLTASAGPARADAADTWA